MNLQFTKDCGFTIYLIDSGFKSCSAERYDDFRFSIISIWIYNLPDESVEFLMDQQIYNLPGEILEISNLVNCGFKFTW